mgnify:CR=1 FL=1
MEPIPGRVSVEARRRLSPRPRRRMRQGSQWAQANPPPSSPQRRSSTCQMQEKKKETVILGKAALLLGQPFNTIRTFYQYTSLCFAIS